MEHLTKRFIKKIVDHLGVLNLQFYKQPRSFEGHKFDIVEEILMKNNNIHIVVLYIDVALKQRAF